jgi:3-methyl-2-oxobutanoate hydroxymethyltransferase
MVAPCKLCSMSARSKGSNAYNNHDAVPASRALPEEFPMPEITLTTLQRQKLNQDKITMLTCYDATFARAASEAGVEILLVGDSLGMVLQGHDSTLPVTNADMAYHVACVKRGAVDALILADLPFMACATLQASFDNSAQLMRAGAHMVKVEGAAWLAETVRLLAERGVPVCVHLGLTPQAVNVLGGYRVQGRLEAQAQQLRADAITLEQAGAAMILLECVPSELAEQITQRARIPVIGIGAGPATDGQVLVLHDMLGLSLSGRVPKFVKNFMAGQPDIQSALRAYVGAVKDLSFPAPEHGFNA